MRWTQLPERCRPALVLRASVADLEGRLAEIAGRRAYLLRAPVAGHVSALQARVGLGADPAVPLLSIVPTGSVLQAELLVPARAIGFVAPGQTVRLAYEAFPYQRFGLHGGHVRTVSRNLLRPAELVAPIAIAEPSYRVTVAARPADLAGVRPRLSTRPRHDVEGGYRVRPPFAARMGVRAGAQPAWTAGHDARRDPWRPAWRRGAGHQAGGDRRMRSRLPRDDRGRIMDSKAISRRCADSYPVSLKGTTLAGLIDTAERMGLAGRPLRLEPASLARLRCLRCCTGT